MDNIQRFALSDLITKKISAGNKENKAAAEAELHAGDRRTVVVEGETLGAVTMTKPRTAYKVTDPDALARWVAEQFPDKVEMVPVPKEWFVKGLLEQAKANGAPITDDGELVPGIEEVTGTSYASLKADPDAFSKLAGLIGSGQLALGELLAIDE